MPRVLPFALLASGEGTTLEGLAEQIDGGRLAARLVLVLSDRPHAPAIERARRRGLPTSVLPFRGSVPGRWSAEASALLRARGAELVVLAGFLAILPREFLADWSGRIVNVHPSLLPRHGGPGMYGRRVHEAVLAAGDRETGVSVHLVTEAVDAGPVLWQHRLDVARGDTPETLRERLHPLEVRGLAEVLTAFADGRWPLPSVGVGVGGREADDRSA